MFISSKVGAETVHIDLTGGVPACVPTVSWTLTATSTPESTWGTSHRTTQIAHSTAQTRHTTARVIRTLAEARSRTVTMHAYQHQQQQHHSHQEQQQHIAAALSLAAIPHSQTSAPASSPSLGASFRPYPSATFGAATATAATAYPAQTLASALAPSDRTSRAINVVPLHPSAAPSSGVPVALSVPLPMGHHVIQTQRMPPTYALVQTQTQPQAAPSYINAQVEGDKSRRRLARKAELARLSRRRKKAYVTELEEKVSQLLRQVEELREANRRGTRYVGPDYSLAMAQLHEQQQRAMREEAQCLEAIDRDSDDVSPSFVAAAAIHNESERVYDGAMTNGADEMEDAAADVDGDADDASGNHSDGESHSYISVRSTESSQLRHVHLRLPHAASSSTSTVYHFHDDNELRRNARVNTTYHAKSTALRMSASTPTLSALAHSYSHVSPPLKRKTATVNLQTVNEHKPKRAHTPPTDADQNNTDAIVKTLLQSNPRALEKALNALLSITINSSATAHDANAHDDNHLAYKPHSQQNADNDHIAVRTETSAA